MRSKFLDTKRLGALAVALVLAAGAAPASADRDDDHPRYVTRHDRDDDDGGHRRNHHRNDGYRESHRGRHHHRPPPPPFRWGRVYDHRDWRVAWRFASAHHHRRDAWRHYLPYHDRYWGRHCTWRHTPHRHVYTHGHIVIRLGD